MVYCMGIDIGSGTSKGVIISSGKLEAFHLLPSGIDYKLAAQELRDSLLKMAGLVIADIASTISTGHGAGLVSFSNKHVADTLCCARGINHLFPSVRTVIDVQRQSSQVIKVNAQGQVVNFAISDACASGSGCFIEVIANILQLELKDIGPLSLKSESPVAFTTGCTVFGESEAISRVAEGVSREDLLAGVHLALAGKLAALADRVGLENPCAISGGGGLNIGLVKSLEKMGFHLLVPPQPQLVNALGAAIMAEEEAAK